MSLLKFSHILLVYRLLLIDFRNIIKVNKLSLPSSIFLSLGYLIDHFDKNSINLFSAASILSKLSISLASFATPSLSFAFGSIPIIT